jgi:hypothetical protein
MNRSTFRIAVALAVLALPAAGAFGQENFPNLTNMGFSTTWTNGSQVPGWDYNGGWNFSTGLPISVTNANGELLKTPDSPRLKFEISQFVEETAILFKEVNWGPVNEITVSIEVASQNWDGSSSQQGEVGIGVDSDGGATGWADVDYPALNTGGDVDWTTVSVGPITKPAGATTFTLVLYCHRFCCWWNAQVDTVTVTTDVNFDVPPEAPSVSSISHATNTWSANNDPQFSFDTVNADEYSYLLDNSATTDPGTVSDGTPATVSYTDVGNYDTDGEWWFHVRAGNSFGWSPTAHFGPLLIDAAPPTVSNVNWTPGTEGGVEVTATVEDTGGSPFGINDIELYGNENVSNNGFESGMIDWATSGSGPFQMSSSVWGPGGAQDGTEWFSTTTGGVIDAVLYQEVPVTAFGKYRLSAYATVGAGADREATVAMNWIDGPFGGPEIPLQAITEAADFNGGWQFLDSLILPTQSTMTVVFRMSSNTTGIEAVGIHLDAVSVTWYPGAPDTYSSGTASWGPIPGIDGELPTVRAVDGAGNEASASASTPLSGIGGLESGVLPDGWKRYE